MCVCVFFSFLLYVKNLEKEGDNGRGGEDEERGGGERMGLLVEGAWQGGRGRTMRKNDGEDIQENRCGGGDGSTGDCRRSGNEEEGEHKQRTGDERRKRSD